MCLIPIPFTRKWFSDLDAQYAVGMASNTLVKRIEWHWNIPSIKGKHEKNKSRMTEGCLNYCVRNYGFLVDELKSSQIAASSSEYPSQQSNQVSNSVIPHNPLSVDKAEDEESLNQQNP